MALVWLEAASVGLLVISHFAFGRPRDLRPVLRRYVSDPRMSPHVGFEYHPRYGHAHALRNVAECGFTTDRYGFIHNGDPGRDFRRARFRIFVMGGSTVAGTGASCNQFTLPALLERRIRDAGLLDVAVVNAGVVGYYSAQELPFVVDEVLRYDPQVVISVTGINDANVSILGDVTEDPSAPLHRAAYYLSPYLRDLRDQRKTMESPLGALAQAIRNVGVLRKRTNTAFLFGALETAARRPELRAPRGMNDPFLSNVVAAYGIYVPRQTLDALLSAPHPEQTAEGQPSLASDAPPAERAKHLDGLARAYGRYMSAEKAALEAQRVRFLCVFQPQLALEHDRLTASEAIAYRIHEIAMQKFKVNYTRDLRWFLRSADEQFRRQGVICSDATGVFAQETGTYSDPIHANDKGNGLLADFILKDLVRQGLLPALGHGPG
jgi:lysophospholipase L1-like esterase